jgi:hypothetical protein
VTTVSRPPGLAVSGMAEIHAAIGSRAYDYASMDGADRELRLAREMYQVPFAGLITITTGAGALGSFDGNGPGSGYFWSVRRLSLQGFSAGTVTLYKNATVNGGAIVGTPEVLPSFPQSGVFTFGRGEVLLNPNDWLGFAAAGITVTSAYAGVQINGTADCFPVELLPEYLM